MEEDFVEESNVEIDEEYEFDASQFFDFTRPEVDSEIEEVERWFDVSGDYPNSPFIVKLDLEKILPGQGVGKSSSSSSSSKPRKSTKSISSSSDTDGSIKHGLPSSKTNAKGEDAAKPKTKSAYKLSQPRNAKFMEPTASHLAKQNTLHHKQHTQLCTRFDRTRTKLDEKKSCIASETRATKRQKLEKGFLKKGSYLRHKFSMSHKSSNKVTSVPREAEVGTLQRSQSRRSKSSCASSESESRKPIKPHHSPNVKSLEARSLPRPRKSKTPLTEFQEFHFKTRERANYHSSAKENRSSTGESPLTLTEEFSKLSLGVGVGSKSKKTPESERRSSASSKSSGSSSRGSFRTDSWQAQGGNQHCGARMRPYQQPNITRSLDIR